MPHNVNPYYLIILKFEKFYANLDIIICHLTKHCHHCPEHFVLKLVCSSNVQLETSMSLHMYSK